MHDLNIAVMNVKRQQLRNDRGENMKVRFKFYLPQEFQGQAIEVDLENESRAHIEHAEKMALYDFAEWFIEIEREMLGDDK